MIGVWLIIFIYVGLITCFIFSWKNINSGESTSGVHTNFHKISVLIPVRNESENILNLLNDLKNQNYPSEWFEVIVINDSSTDDTELKVRDFIMTNTNVSIINLPSHEIFKSYKKAAITYGIFHSTGSVIVTTDGDCRAGKNWLESINRRFNSKDFVCLCGPVTFIDQPSFFNKFQILEFAALLGSGAATIAMKLPGMCNGANFAYLKKAFQQVNGFEGIEHVASGDDELLMHKLLDEYPGKVGFLKDHDAIVMTKSNENIGQLFQQRKRWAGKWSYYKMPFVKILALFIFTINFYFALGWVLVALKVISLKIFILQYIIKAFIEGLFIYLILKFLKKKIHLVYFLVLQLVYPYYTTFFGIVANFGSYTWKERKVIK